MGKTRTIAYPCFVENDQLVYRLSRVAGTGNIILRLLVLKPFRAEVMRLPYDILFSGHLGREKTEDRILARFY